MSRYALQRMRAASRGSVAGAATLQIRCGLAWGWRMRREICLQKTHGQGKAGQILVARGPSVRNM